MVPQQGNNYIMNDFSNRLNEILNHGALNLALAIGYKNPHF